MGEEKSVVPRASVNTRALLAIAAVFVVNSHLEAYYPWPFLAGDGLFGYGLFFFVAGLGLALSAKRDLRSFSDYYWRRVARVYPTFLLIRVSFFLIEGEFTKFKPHQYLTVFVWPTENTFIGPLMVDYALLYFVLRPQSVEVIRKVLLGMMVPIVALWVYLLPDMHLLQAMPLNWLWAGIAFFQLMLLGSYLGARLEGERQYMAGWDTVAVIFLFATYVAARLMIQRGTLPSGLYPLLFVLLAGIFYFMLQLARSTELELLLKRLPLLAKAAVVLGTTTLELYFVHERLVPMALLQQIMFPLNIVALWVLLVPLAMLLEKTVTAFRRRYLGVN